jgi:glycosyltransferase involved in cell wall biosynthesis
MKKIKLLSVLVPAYNEEKYINTVLDRIQNVKLVGDIAVEIIIVNDGSTDNTQSVVEAYIAQHQRVEIRLIKLHHNQGKGSAIRKAMEMANGEYLVVQDADLEYDPEDYNKLLHPVLAGVADVVYGSRFVGGQPHRILFFWHSLGNRFLTFLSNALTNLNLTDMETCYKLVDSRIAKSLELRENRFGFEPELTAKLARVPNIRLYEVGISYHGRTYKEGKKIGWRDGFHAIYCILKYNLMK